MRILSLFLLMLLSVSAFCQKSLEKKLSDATHVVIADSFNIKILSGKSNHIKVTGDDYSLKNFVIKQKKGYLYLYQTDKVRMTINGEAQPTQEINFSEIVLTLNQKVENISVSNTSKIDFQDEFSTRRLILKASDNSQIHGKFSCDAFGLFLSGGAEGYVSGKFRTAKVIADSSKAVASEIQVENSEFQVSGGSLVSVKGKTVNMKLTVKGLSRFEALQFNTQNTLADISGNSDVFFNCSNSLTINAKERSHIVTTGNPKINKNVTKDCKFGRR